jgi:hypothetical protein
VLAHLFQHDIHHRGQVHAMLAGTAVAPPQLDEFFLAQDADLRAEDLRAMGLAEGGLVRGAKRFTRDEMQRFPLDETDER